jgi:hypothetical protein
MTLTSQTKFSPGRIVVTPAALSMLSGDDIRSALSRHLSGDWGDLGKTDREENQESLAHGRRLLSVYHNSDGIQFWIITEADRSVTNVYLPDHLHGRDMANGHGALANTSRKANHYSPRPAAAPSGLTFRFRLQ